MKDDELKEFFQKEKQKAYDELGEPEDEKGVASMLKFFELWHPPEIYEGGQSVMIGRPPLQIMNIEKQARVNLKNIAQTVPEIELLTKNSDD